MPTLSPRATAPQAPAVAGPAAPVQSLEALQAQLVDQAQQLSVLNAQRRVIQSQLNVTAPGALHNTLESQMEALNGRIVNAQVEMAATRAQFASRLGIPVERIGPNGRLTFQSYTEYAPRRGPDPDVIVGMSFTLAIAVAFPLAIAYARRIWRGKPAATPATGDTVSPRLDRLEQAVDAIAIEIERVAEGQRFVTKVLAERPPQAHANLMSDAPAAREGASPLAEGKPFLALGAGPIEPIRAAERQAVRPSITPH